jgi:hypothetical protein
MFCPESRLCRGVEVHRVGLSGQTMVHGRHEYLRDWWGDRDTPIVFWFCRVPLALVQGYNLSCAPGLWGGRCNRAGIKEMREASYTRWTHKFKEVGWYYTVSPALSCLVLLLQYKS